MKKSRRRIIIKENLSEMTLDEITSLLLEPGVTFESTSSLGIDCYTGLPINKDGSLDMSGNRYNKFKHYSPTDPSQPTE